MPHNKRFAATIEKELIPFLESIESYLAGSGIEAAGFSSYTDMRKWFEEASKIIRDGGHLWAPTADAALMKLDDLQDTLPIILHKMPPEFTLRWNAMAERLEKDNQAMIEE